MSSARFLTKNYFNARIYLGHAQHLRSFSKSPFPSRQVIFSGIQPTGVPHLGNFLGALQQWVQLQNEAPPSTDLVFSVVDLHAITVNQDANQLRLWKRQTLAALLAVGLDPDRSILFYQSSVPAHAELMWILGCSASTGYLSRMTQWKSKLALANDASVFDQVAKSKLKLGLFSYPVLQAADILLYGTTHVPVGEDQIQHIEFTRECAGTFNATYGYALQKPDIILSPAKRVMSLKDPRAKMSKSDPDTRSRILLSDTPEDIRLKIRLALTDSTPEVYFDESRRPGVSNLIRIMAHLNQEVVSIEEVAQHCKSLTMREFKDEVTKTIVTGLESIRGRYKYYLEADNGRYIDEIAIEGSKKAHKKAEITIAKIRHCVGLS